MVRNATSVLDNLISGSPFNFVIDFKRISETSVVKSEININSSSLKII